MDIVIKYLKNYAKTRTIKFYITSGIAVLSFVTAIVYIAALGHLTKYISIPAFVLLLLSGIAFIAFSLAGLDRIGAAVMGVMNFIGFLVYLESIYGYPIEVAMTGLPEEFGAIIAVAVMALICTIASNVLAWLRLRRKETSDACETTPVGGEL